MSINPFIAFVLSFIPGLGHFYIRRKLRPFLYAAGFFGPLGLIFLLVVSGSHGAGKPAMFLLVCALLVWVVNMLDMIVTLATGRYPQNAYWIQGPEGQAGPYMGEPHTAASPQAVRLDNERFYTILLSLIPGLGHFHLGLMQRGLTLCISFFGLAAMIVFVSVVTRSSGFAVFLLALPVLWLYGLFDAARLAARRQNGEVLEDRSIFDELEQHRSEGRKSRVAATLLAVIPGAGHMYLGLQRRGLQFMGAFFLSLYVLDLLRLSLFLFLIPLLWFYSLFDALQSISKYGREELKDVPLVDWLMNHQKWIGIALLAAGLYYLADRAALPFLDRFVPEWQVSRWFHMYFQTVAVSVVLIGGGLKLLAGSRRGGSGEEL